MAAEYPPYLRYDGMREDRYAALNEFGDIQYTNEYMVRGEFLEFVLWTF